MASYNNKMKVFVTSLCLLFWSLVEVNSQSVYLSLNGTIILNHGYVRISDIGSTDNTALLCITNKPTRGGNSGGEWFAPDGTRVAGTAVPGFKRNRGPMVVRLLRNTATGTPAEGIYDCVVEDDTFRAQTVYVGLYNSGGGIAVTKLCCNVTEVPDWNP